MKDPSQYDLQRVGLKGLPLITERWSGPDFRGIHVEKGVGFEHLSPIASHPEGLDSSDLVRGALGSSSITRRWVFCGVHTSLRCFHPWSLSPGDGMGGSTSFFPLWLQFPFILVSLHSLGSTCRVVFMVLILVPSAHP